MSETEVTLVRVYLHEAKSQMEELLKYLHDESKVRGVTVFRGVTGFGVSGEYHSSKLIDMSLDLPIVIEFFDEPEKEVEGAIFCAEGGYVNDPDDPGGEPRCHDPHFTTPRT